MAPGSGLGFRLRSGDLGAFRALSAARAGALPLWKRATRVGLGPQSVSDRARMCLGWEPASARWCPSQSGLSRRPLGTWRPNLRVFNRLKTECSPSRAFTAADPSSEQTRTGRPQTRGPQSESRPGRIRVKKEERPGLLRVMVPSAVRLVADPFPSGYPAPRRVDSRVAPGSYPRKTRLKLRVLPEFSPTRSVP